MTAFKNIPPWQDFQKGSESDMLKMRLRFTGNPDTSAPADTGNNLAAWPSNIYMFFLALWVLSEPSEDPTQLRTQKHGVYMFGHRFGTPRYFLSLF